MSLVFSGVPTESHSMLINVCVKRQHDQNQWFNGSMMLLSMWYCPANNVHVQFRGSGNLCVNLQVINGVK